MSWDPITRIVGCLGIHTEIDFDAKKVEKAYSTSMIFRGFDIFMKGIDPRDTHFITSRICGICGDNHCTTSCLNQNMAYGVKPPALGDLGYNLAETADYMFDHAIFNDCMANVDFCEQMVKETNPSLLQKAESTPAPGSDVHGYKTIADIMRALNPFTGDFYLETLQVARYTREMYCLFGGRHTHPSTIMPGGVSVDITHQTCTDYYVRLMRYIDYVKRAVPMHDDLYDFFLQELPGYDMVGYRDTDLVCWGYFDDPDYVDYDYRNMTEWGRKRYVTPGVVLKGELITTDLVEINLMMRILLGSSYFDDWTDEETFVTQDPLGNPVDKRHPWNKVTLPKPQKRDWQDKYSWVASPRMYDERNDTYVACDTGGGPFARSWVTAKAGLVDFGYAKATGESIKMVLPRTASKPEMELEWKIPEKSNAIERDRARTYHEAFSALIGLHYLERALKEVREGRTKSWNDFKVPAGGHLGRLLRGRPRRALAPHGDPGRQGGELPAVPADALEQQPARHLRDSRPLRGCGAEHADLRGERPGEFQGRRHHAGGAELRSVPALRRPHVQPAGRPGPQGDPHPDRDVLSRSRSARNARREIRSGQPRGPDPEGRGADRGGRAAPGPGCAPTAEDLVSAVIEMYGQGLERIVEILDEDEGAGEIKQQLADDGVVASLMLIHDLYPVPVEERVAEALDNVRPYMESHGGNVELVSLEEGVARLRLEGSCDGCPASSSTLELAIKTALEEAAPDLLGIEVEGIEQDLLNPVVVTGTPLPMAEQGGERRPRPRHRPRPGHPAGTS